MLSMAVYGNLKYAAARFVWGALELKLGHLSQKRIMKITNFKPLVLISIFSIAGCAEIPAEKVAVVGDAKSASTHSAQTVNGQLPILRLSPEDVELFISRWTNSSGEVFSNSLFPEKIRRIAKFEITLNGVVNFNCDNESEFSLISIQPITQDSNKKFSEEIWTTDVCGVRKWIVNSNGKATLLKE
jgi:hypothetical protein